MFVVASAGHVDHGKSTLVRALTGMEPDRWAEEHRRGMTIDLGFAWTTLPTGETLAFVDVPGHQRFIANMLAGVGPSPAVLFVVAADEGWRRQSEEHLAAIDALGIEHGLLAVTRSDLADPTVTLTDARTRLGRTSLGDVEAVAVSGVTGIGLDELRAALSRLVRGVAPPRTQDRVRLWIDRAFTVRGSGTVVTATLGAGSVATGQQLDLNGRLVRVRGIQQLGRAGERATAVARVALNLAAVAREDIARGDVLLTPGAWRHTAAVDVRLHPSAAHGELVLHIGSAAVPVRVRPLAGEVARLTLRRALPLQRGDRGVLRDPGQQAISAGFTVIDADPPSLQRRGAAARRAAALAVTPPLEAEVGRRGAVRCTELAAIGVALDDLSGVLVKRDWLVTAEQWSAWRVALEAAVDAADPAHPGVAVEQARRGLPDAELLGVLTGEAGLETYGGRVRRPGVRPALGAAEDAVRLLEQRLGEEPFAAPDRAELDALRLRARDLAVAAESGRLIRLGADVVLLPSAPALAGERLRGLEQPFTTSQARQALATTRRVAVPLLEHLDALGVTERVDDSRRRLADWLP